jgi:ribosome-binding protein aMBF1 (putative translation factor)
MERTFHEIWDALKEQSREARKELEQEVRSDVGKMIWLCRAHHQMERKTLSRISGVRVRVIKKIEEDGGKGVRLSDVVAVAQALGLRLTVRD